jgi:hypothetical protein
MEWNSGALGQAFFLKIFYEHLLGVAGGDTDLGGWLIGMEFRRIGSGFFFENFL